MNQEQAFAEIRAERGRQSALYDPPDGSSLGECIHANCVSIYTGKLASAVSCGDSVAYRKRLIQLGALAVQGLESLDQDEEPEPEEDTILIQVREIAAHPQTFTGFPFHLGYDGVNASSGYVGLRLPNKAEVYLSIPFQSDAHRAAVIAHARGESVRLTGVVIPRPSEEDYCDDEDEDDDDDE